MEGFRRGFMAEKLWSTAVWGQNVGNNAGHAVTWAGTSRVVQLAVYNHTYITAIYSGEIIVSTIFRNKIINNANKYIV